MLRIIETIPILKCDTFDSQSRWPRGLRYELSSPAQTLGSWVRIPLETWMSVCVYSVIVWVAALRQADPPSKESYRSCKRSRNWKPAKVHGLQRERDTFHISEVSWRSNRVSFSSALRGLCGRMQILVSCFQIWRQIYLVELRFSREVKVLTTVFWVTGPCSLVDG
jgi:hypothetical protein